MWCHNSNSFKTPIKLPTVWQLFVKLDNQFWSLLSDCFIKLKRHTYTSNDSKGSQFVSIHHIRGFSHILILYSSGVRYPDFLLCGGGVTVLKENMYFFVWINVSVWLSVCGYVGMCIWHLNVLGLWYFNGLVLIALLSLFTNRTNLF